MYQTGKSPQLFEEYAGLLKADPTNSDLLYLCGRVCEEPEQSRDYFTRARQAAPENPYPLFALAYDQIMRGEWQEAKPALDQAVKLVPGDEHFRRIWRIACMALGQFDQAEKVFRDMIKKNPTDWQATEALCDILAAQEKRAEANAAAAELLRAYNGAAPDSVAQVRSEVQTHNLYATGDFEEMERIARRDRSALGRFALFQALVEQNRFDDAAKIMPLKEIKDSEMLIAVSLALRVANKTAEAEEWKAAFIQSLRGKGKDSEHLADCLKGQAEIKLTDLDEVPLNLPYRAALLTEVALTHPQLHDPLIKNARQINVERTFPYHLVQRAIASAP